MVERRKIFRQFFKKIRTNSKFLSMVRLEFKNLKSKLINFKKFLEQKALIFSAFIIILLEVCGYSPVNLNSKSYFDTSNFPLPHHTEIVLNSSHKNLENRSNLSNPLVIRGGENKDVIRGGETKNVAGSKAKKQIARILDQTDSSTRPLKIIKQTGRLVGKGARLLGSLTVDFIESGTCWKIAQAYANGGKQCRPLAPTGQPMAKVSELPNVDVNHLNGNSHTQLPRNRTKSGLNQWKNFNDQNLKNITPSQRIMDIPSVATTAKPSSLPIFVEAFGGINTPPTHRGPVSGGLFGSESRDSSAKPTLERFTADPRNKIIQDPDVAYNQVVDRLKAISTQFNGEEKRNFLNSLNNFSKERFKELATENGRMTFKTVSEAETAIQAELEGLHPDYALRRPNQEEIANKNVLDFRNKKNFSDAKIFVAQETLNHDAQVLTKHLQDKLQRSIDPIQPITVYQEGFNSGQKTVQQKFKHCEANNPHLPSNYKDVEHLLNLIELPFSEKIALKQGFIEGAKIALADRLQVPQDSISTSQVLEGMRFLNEDYTIPRIN